MKVLNTFLTGLFFVTHLGLGFSSQLGCAHTSTQPEVEQSLLYRVTSQSGASSYVFGTIHIVPQDRLVWKEHMQDALDQSQALWLEIDMTDMKSIEQELLKHVVMPGHALRDHVPADEYAEWEKRYAEETGMPLSFVANWYPVLASAPLLQKQAGPSGTSVEQFILRKALEKKLSIYGLETVEEQIRALSEVPIDAQVQMLRSLLFEKEMSQKDFERMVHFYAAEDLKGLWNDSQEDLEELQAEQALLSLRNKRWVTRLVPLMEQGGAFIAVGALHLPGETGLLHQLRRKGFTVEPVVR